MEVHAPGFKAFRKTGIVIDANSVVRVDVTMSLGATTEQPEGRSDAVQVETQSTQTGEVITGTRMTAVPLNGPRIPTALVAARPRALRLRRSDAWHR